MAKKEFARIKIVTTCIEHQCEVCSKSIPKRTKALNNYGFSKEDGYFSVYFHLTRENKCYLEFMETCWIRPESGEGKLILENVSPPMQMDEAKTLLGIIS